MMKKDFQRSWIWIVLIIPLIFLAGVNTALATGEDPVFAVPVASQASGSYTVGFDLILSSATAGASIYYTKTTDGTIPSAPVPGTPGTVLYEGSIPVTGTTNIMAIAAMQVDSTWASSGIAFFSYSIINRPSPPPGGGGGGAGGPASAGGPLGYLDQSQVAFNNAFVTIENTAAWIQTFTPGTDCLLTAVGVHIRRSVDWDINQMGDLIMEIVATDTNGVPTNMVLGSATVPRDYNFPSAEGYWSNFTFEATNFIFNPGIELQAGTKYGIKLASPGTTGGVNGLYYWPVYHDGQIDQYIPGNFYQQINGGIPQSSSIDNMVDATYKTYMLPMAQLPMNSIKLDTASQQVYSGQSFPVEIKILQADNVYAADLELNFDHGVLQVAKVDAGQDLDNDGQEDQRPDVWVNLDDNNAGNGEEPFTVIGAIQVDNDLGRLRIAATRTGDSYLDRYLGFSGDVTLARVMFQAVTPGFTVLDLAAELRGNAGAEDSVVELLPAACCCCRKLN